MTFKGIPTFTLIFSVALVHFASTGYGYMPMRGSSNGSPHNLILGHLKYEDRLLYHIIVYVKSQWFRKVSQDIIYPNHGVSTANITHIRAIDMKRNGTGGYPYLIKGGIGYRNVTIRIESQPGHGIHYNISIFGK